MSTKPIVFTCGGTGGHVTPAIALAQELSSQYPCHFLGTSDREDHRIVQAYHFLFTAIGTRHLKGWNLIRSLFNGLLTLLKKRPKIIISTGGGQTAVVIACAWLLRIPIVLLEQNAIPGRTNRWLSHLATHIITAFPPRPGDFPPQKTHLLGNPVRKTYLQEPWFPDFAAQVPDNRPIILIFGGSQGAKALNTWCETHYKNFLAAGFTVIHLTGKTHANQPWEQVNPHLFRIAYTEAMDWLYTRATLVISRSGATSIAELIAFQKKAILVPFPFAKDDHQRANAAYFCKKFPGVVIEETALSWDNFQTSWDTLSPQIFPTQPIQAREKIAQFIHNLITKNKAKS